MSDEQLDSDVAFILRAFVRTGAAVETAALKGFTDAVAQVVQRLKAPHRDAYAACEKLTGAWFEETGGAFRLSELNAALALARAALLKATPERSNV